MLILYVCENCYEYYESTDEIANCHYCSKDICNCCCFTCDVCGEDVCQACMYESGESNICIDCNKSNNKG